ncbi:transcription antitermination factor NusB [Desulfuromonas sp. AOP6]|uniref:transcription antitermination factor NusB n=1 Tax=Desulfuromonas sp. AOP6 TaxID=1566351 RepID=UPI00127E4A10|nr:transcription antitermination factor NusB [Desulfuromonas sp. AOP6]BCA79804.1 N utilization substance protein B [Desulfuromonas sp. AOP6]
MGTRRKGRELALKIIYSLFDQNTSIDAVLEDFWRNFHFQDDILGDPVEGPPDSVPSEQRHFTEELIYGVDKHLEQIDKVISSHSTNWSLDRMSRVDLSLLRLAVYELLYRPDIPSNVVINEAIEIGKRYGTVETPSFINGILDKISRENRHVVS